jgi:hypothetical protein
MAGVFGPLNLDSKHVSKGPTLFSGVEITFEIRAQIGVSFSDVG